MTGSLQLAPHFWQLYASNAGKSQTHGYSMRVISNLGIANDEKFAETFSRQFLGNGSRPGPWTYAIDAMRSSLQAQFKFAKYIFQTIMDTLALVQNQWL